MAAAISRAWTTTSSRSRGSARSSSSRAKRNGARTTCASVSASRPTSRERTTSTSSRNTAGPGSTTSAGLRALLFVDQLDNAWFPRRGFRIVAKAYAADEAVGSDRTYQRLDGQLSAVRTWDAHTVNFAISGGTDLHSDMPGYESFTLGGPLRLSGYRIDQFSGSRFAFGRLMYYNRAIPLPDLLGSGLFLGGSLEAGRIQSS